MVAFEKFSGLTGAASVFFFRQPPCVKLIARPDDDAADISGENVYRKFSERLL